MNFLNIVFIYISTTCFVVFGSHEKQKRFVLFPETFVMQLTGGIAVPSNIPNRTFAINMCMQANFNAISNISQLTPTVIQAKSNRNIDFDRFTLYTYISNILSSYMLNGDKCFLKTICELAEIPLHNSGLLERILQYILTPSYNTNDNNEMLKYYEAETIGKLNGNCSEVYFECKESLLKMITTQQSQ